MEIGSWIKTQICAPGGIQLLPALASAGHWLTATAWWWAMGDRGETGIIAGKKSPGYWTHQVTLVLFTEQLGLCVLGTVEYSKFTDCWLTCLIMLTTEHHCTIVSVPTGCCLCCTEACEGV